MRVRSLVPLRRDAPDEHDEERDDLPETGDMTRPPYRGGEQRLDDPDDEPVITTSRSSAARFGRAICPRRGWI